MDRHLNITSITMSDSYCLIGGIVPQYIKIYVLELYVEFINKSVLMGANHS